jgi:hypothetical protein
MEDTTMDRPGKSLTLLKDCMHACALVTFALKIKSIGS